MRGREAGGVDHDGAAVSADAGTGSAADPDATPPRPVALDLRDHVLFDPDEPRTQPIAHAGRLGLQLVCLEPGQALAARTLPVDRLYTVIGGRAWAVVEDAEIHLDPLQAVLVPAGSAHGLRNDSPDPLILQVVDGGHVDAGATTSDAAPAPPTAPSPQEGGRRDPAVPDDPRDRFARIRRLLGSGD